MTPEQEFAELRALIHDALLTVKTAASEMRLENPNDAGADDLDDAARKLTRARAIATAPLSSTAEPDRERLIRDMAEAIERVEDEEDGGPLDAARAALAVMDAGGAP